MFSRLHNLLKLSVFTFTLLFLSSTAWADFCIPDYVTGTSDGDYIDGVELGDISNFTGPGEDWNDYTDLSTLLNPGLTYNLTVYNTPEWEEYYQAWIDWNQDEIFTDDEKLSTEDVFIDPGGTATISFTVPFAALPGNTRMRVMCVYYPGAAIDPCSVLYNFGEAEDYTIQIPAAGPYDLGVTDINGLETSCGLGLTPINVTITNLGTEPSGDFDVAYVVTNPILGVLPAVVQAYTGPDIPSFGSVSFTFAVSANLSNIGEYTIEAYTIYDLDVEPLDDASDVTFTSVPTISTFPYYQEFEEGPSGWMSGGVLSTWELGDPAGFAIDGPPPATPGSINSWTTELDDYYNLNEKSYVVSPCLDFSSLILPYIEFDLNYDTQLFDDGAKMQYSTDGGATWADLGSIGTGENWYNHAYNYSMWPTFYIDNYNGWAGNSGGWIHAKHDLSFLAGETNVQLRFVFASGTYWNFNDGFAFDNVRIADPFPDDVGVISIDAPSSGPSLSDVEPVTVTIKNFGTESQSSFSVTYRVIGFPAHTQTFGGTIDPGETASFTFSATADLSDDGDYELRAWTGLPGDDDIYNDTTYKSVSNLLPIAGTGAYYIYSNVLGAEPFYSTSNSTHMDDVFGVGGWTTDYFETLDPAVVFGLGTCFVYMDGSADLADEMESFFDLNEAQIENWVASGGHLFINAAPYEGDGMNFGFDGTHLNYWWYSSQVEAYDPGHPIWSGAFTPVSTSMTGGNYGHASISGTGLTPILFDYFSPDKYICAEKSWGAGDVIFGGMTVTEWHEPLVEAGNFRKNLLSYLAICTISNNDVGVQSILTPQSACGMTTEETISVVVKNFGFLAQTNIPVSYSVDGAPDVTEIIPGTLDIGESVTYTFSTPADFSLVADHPVEVWTELATDTIYSNDSTISTVTNIPVINSFPYNEDWEVGTDDGWRHYGAGDEWELGYPAGPIIAGPPPTTPTSQYSWATDLDDVYEDGEDNFLESPCFDMTDLILPYVDFDIYWYTEDTYDGVQLEYSTDGGATWTLLGGIGTGDNWYTNNAIALGYDPDLLIYETGWVGYGTGWQTAHHDVGFLAGETDVKFRFRFASDGSVVYDGVAIDNFKISDPVPNDLGVTELVTPVSGAALTGSEVVSVMVKNFGILSQTNFPVTYKADGGAEVTEIYTGTLAPGVSALFTFAATADLESEELHEICSWTDLVADENHANDSIPGCADIMHFPPVTGTGSYYIYSNTVGYEPGYMLSNSTAMNTVFGAGVWTLDYYEELDIASVFNETNCFIFLEGSEQHFNEFENFLNNNQSWIEGWVSSGGHLLINASPWEGDGGDIGFDNMHISYPWYTYNSTAVDPLHPVLTGPYTPVTADFYGFYVSEARISGDGISPIISDLDSTNYYLLVEKAWGDGQLMVGTMGAPEYYTPTDESQNLRQNMLDYLKLCAPVDIGVTALISPAGGCGMTSEQEVTIEITNFGSSSVTNIPVYYKYDALPEVFEIALGPVPIGGTYTYTFDATIDAAILGDHTLIAWTDFSGDEDVTNDLLSTDFTSLETPVLEFGANTTVCDETTLDAGNPGSTYLWSTGEITQTISVTESGTYSVTVTNPSSGCTVTDNITVTVNYTPVSGFTYTADGLTVIFTNTSTDGATYSWSFGDGTTSTEEDPSHTYGADGTYTVTLTVTNSCGSAFYSFVIEVETAVNDVDLANAVSVYPNPTSTIATIDAQLIFVSDISLQLVNTLGEVVWSAEAGSVNSIHYEINVSGFADGVYQLNIMSNDKFATKSIVITK